MVVLSIIQISSSLTTLGDFMVILFSSHPEGSCFFFGLFSFLMVSYSDDLQICSDLFKYRALKVELL